MFPDSVIFLNRNLVDSTRLLIISFFSFCVHRFSPILAPARLINVIDTLNTAGSIILFSGSHLKTLTFPNLFGFLRDAKPYILLQEEMQCKIFSNKTASSCYQNRRNLLDIRFRHINRDVNYIWNNIKKFYFWGLKIIKTYIK